MSITLLVIYSRAGKNFLSGLELRNYNANIKSSVSEYIFVTTVNFYEEIFLLIIRTQL